MPPALKKSITGLKEAATRGQGREGNPARWRRARQLRRCPEREIRAPDINRNSTLPQGRSANALPTIFVESHCTLTFINVAN